MPQAYEFDEVGILAGAGDNVAIATRRLEAGTTIRYGALALVLDHTVMEGHRFAVKPIGPGEDLLSWGQTFGISRCRIEPGAYVCNRGMLEALTVRGLDIELPAAPNLEDNIEVHRLDEADFHPGRQVELYAQPLTFSGYGRGTGRGVGTRNYILVLATSSRTGSFAQVLAERLRAAAADCGHLDGVVAMSHTEGGGSATPNNRVPLLRTLAGCLVHPNVGAVLAVDRGTEAVTNRVLQDFMGAEGYPLDRVPHHFLSLTGGFEAHLAEGEKLLREWLPLVDAERRADFPLEHLKIALQCGGSDAFSGISGNPLAGWVAREVIRHGGSAVLGETAELIGAESYVLQNVRDLSTARSFLEAVARFKERAAWHGSSAAGNPSGGNKLRGLYNIVLKSLGAGMKRHPDVRLDHVIEYAERLGEAGYYFMDSPGNDLEGMAGQVAGGCNMIFFITGNGSVVNFPIAPTIKFVSTTRRYDLLSAEMDVNAGAYQDGTPMEELGQEVFELAREVASGRASAGELAGHSQASIWRNWPQTDGSNLERLLSASPPVSEQLAIREETGPEIRFDAFRVGEGHAIDQVGLILPASLCSAQIARLSAERLNASGLGREHGISRFVSLLHTEGCGLLLRGATEQLYVRTMAGYLTHPLVRKAVVLEHGCEMTHNDYIRNELALLGLDPEAFGWASVQLDGGIERVLDKVEGWFREQLPAAAAGAIEEVGLEAVHLGIASSGCPSDDAARGLARLTRWVVGGGGSVVVADNEPLLSSPAYAGGVLAEQPIQATLAYGQRLEVPGFHLMEAPTDHWVECLTGLGAAGVEMVLVHAGDHPVQGHPLLPVVQVSSDRAVQECYREDLDLSLGGAPEQWPEQILELLIRVASRQYTPRVVQQKNTDFQLTRGLLGVSA